VRVFENPYVEKYFTHINLQGFQQQMTLDEPTLLQQAAHSIRRLKKNRNAPFLNTIRNLGETFLGKHYFQTPKENRVRPF